MITEFAPVKIEKTMTMAILFKTQLNKFISLPGIIRAQTFGKIVVYTRVLLLLGYREGKGLLFGKTVE
jgi:hypothetical protein